MREGDGRAVDGPQAAGRGTSGDFDVVVPERLADLAARLDGRRQPDLQVLMVMGLLTAEQVKRPARRE